MSEKSQLMTLSQPRSPAAEAYRTLRTNLIFAGLDKPLQSLIVTSAAPNAEPTITLANLAVTMAQGERRTLLVDADLRRPSLHEIFDVPNRQGLTTLFLEPERLQNPPLEETGVENLTLLPSGPLPPNPADLLGSHRMEEVIEVLLTHADVLLFNAPPVLAVSDAAILGTKVDGLLLVIQSGSTRRDHVQQSQELLERAKVRLVGSVLTGAPRDATLGGYYSS